MKKRKPPKFPSPYKEAGMTSYGRAQRKTPKDPTWIKIREIVKYGHVWDQFKYSEKTLCRRCGKTRFVVEGQVCGGKP